MALADWQVQVYLDTMSVYRKKVDPSSGANRGRTLGVVLVVSGLPCNFHRTPNYDTSRGPIRSKENNIFTANMIECDFTADVRAGDMILIVTRMGDSEWQSVQGAPQKRLALPRTKLYGVPTNAPVITT